MLAFRRLVSRFVVGGTLLAGVARAEDPVAPSARWQGADAPYLKKAGEPIHRRWQGFVRELARMPAGSPYGNAGLEVYVALTVEPDGTISRVHPEKQSGLKGFDDAPLELLKDVRQLPPPPSMLASDDGKTHLLWRFRRSEPDLDEGVVVEARLPLAEALPRLVAAGATDRAIARVAEAWRPGSEGEALLGKLAAALADGGATSGDPVVRVAAVRVLAHLDGSDARLLQLAADPDASVRRAALGALGGKRG